MEMEKKWKNYMIQMITNTNETKRTTIDVFGILLIQVTHNKKIVYYSFLLFF